jgi:hypothetical protein
LRDLVLRQGREHFLQGRDQPRALGEPHHVGREARVRRQFLQAELLDKARPLLVAGDADEELAATGGGETFLWNKD